MGVQHGLPVAPSGRSRPRSARLFAEAQRYIIGGVNSPSRSFYGVGGGVPPFIERAAGAYLWDADGHRYIDYIGAYGPLVFGHAHPRIVAAIRECAERGTVYGAPTELETAFARRLCEAIPSLERIRFVNSGTEAVVSAVRVARAYTGRTRLIKFEGCYHGHSDIALVKAGSGPATLGIADSAGVPPAVAADVLSLPYNDIPALRQAFDRHGGEIAAVLVEPVVGNMGIVLPEPGFLPAISALARAHGALVIYDEVITAFRARFGAAQDALGVRPDLTCLGKAIGGGLPIGAYGGRRDVMDFVAPLGPAYQAGTLAGNPLSVSAGMAALDVLSEPGTYERLERLTRRLAEGVLAAARRHGVPATANVWGSGFTLFFGPDPVRDYASARRSDAGAFARFFHQMLARGVHLAPSRFEAWFLSVAHTDADVEQTIAAADASLASLAAG